MMVHSRVATTYHHGPAYAQAAMRVAVNERVVKREEVIAGSKQRWLKQRGREPPKRIRLSGIGITDSKADEDHNGLPLQYHMRSLSRCTESCETVFPMKNRFTNWRTGDANLSFVIIFSDSVNWGIETPDEGVPTDDFRDKIKPLGAVHSVV